jgi:hypothetical protein
VVHTWALREAPLQVNRGIRAFRRIFTDFSAGRRYHWWETFQIRKDSIDE